MDRKTMTLSLEEERDMGKVLSEIMMKFGEDKKVFSNEQDFQFELAQALTKVKCQDGKTNYIKEVNLEVLSFPKDDLKKVKNVEEPEKYNLSDFIQNNGSLDLNIIEESEDEESKEEGDVAGNKQSKKTKVKKEYTDIIVKTKNDEYYAIELKFKGADKAYLYSSIDGNVAVMAHGAADINSYLFLNDIKRLEDINTKVFPREISIEKGFAILLTNYIKYQKKPSGNAKVWNAFSLYKRTIERNTELKVNSQVDKIKEKYPSIMLRKDCVLDWKKYPLPDRSRKVKQDVRNEAPCFWFLLVEVDSNDLGQNVESPSSN